MFYRTKTYLAGDWDGDRNAIDKIHEWNKSNYFSGLDFVDVHEFVQAKDTSLPCSIKSSLAERMRMSKTFVLVVGEHTKALTKGTCLRCKKCIKFDDSFAWCSSQMRIDRRSFIEYECDLAVRERLKIVVLYNSAKVRKELCPDAVKNLGNHTAMKKRDYEWHAKTYVEKWDYQAVKDAIML